jgi:uncharacterized ion transporter superfamily protein YfcC
MSGGNNKQISARPPAVAPLSEETVQRMLALQEAKIGLEVKQAEISLREIEHNQKIADKSIQAQAEDRKDERSVQKTMDLHRLVFAAVVVAMLLSFVVVALWMNKDALVLDVIKVLIGFVGGWGASIAWRQHRAGTPKDD